MSLNYINPEKNELSWLDISSILKELSIALKNNNRDKISELLVEFINFNISTAKNYDIDLDNAWKRWRKKALSKVYN